MKDHEVTNIEHLSSGEVASLTATSKDRECRYHEGEVMKFYCETCEELICKECIMCYHLVHQYVRLQDAIKSQSKTLADLAASGEKSKKKYRDAIEKIKQVEKDLVTTSQEAKKNLKKIQDDVLIQMDVSFKITEAELDALQLQKITEISSLENDLQTKLSTIENACDVASQITQMGAGQDITSIYPTLSASLKDLCAQSDKLKTDHEGLGYIGVETLTKPDYMHMVRLKQAAQWAKVGEFTELPEPWAIAVHPNGDLAVTSDLVLGAMICSQTGQVKYNFEGPFKSQLQDISTTPDGRYIITGDSEILFYDIQGVRMATNSVTMYDVNDQLCNPLNLATDPTGKIIASSYSGRTFSIHYADGQLISKFCTPVDPVSHDITVDGHIVATFGDKSVHLLDYSGKKIQTLQPPPNVTSWRPFSVCCSKQGEIFVVTRGDPKAVFRYTADGSSCLGCIISDSYLEDPISIAVTEDGQKIFLTEPDQNLVKVFQRQ